MFFTVFYRSFLPVLTFLFLEVLGGSSLLCGCSVCLLLKAGLGGREELELAKHLRWPLWCCHCN